MKTTKKPEFDDGGYQRGRPHFVGEAIDFDSIAKTQPLTREEEAIFGLPSPEELVSESPSTKITLAVDVEALDFFKGEAKRLNTSYQRMMRNLLTAYASQARLRQPTAVSRKAPAARKAKALRP